MGSKQSVARRNSEANALSKNNSAESLNSVPVSEVPPPVSHQHSQVPKKEDKSFSIGVEERGGSSSSSKRPERQRLSRGPRLNRWAQFTGEDDIATNPVEVVSNALPPEEKWSEGKIPPTAEPSASPLRQDWDAPAEGQDLEFELWVEANLQAEWCLEDNSKSKEPDHDAPEAPASGGGEEESPLGSCESGGGWKERCRTSYVRRRWEDFEALGHSNYTLPIDVDRGGLSDASPRLDIPRRDLPPMLTLEASLEILGLPNDTQVEASQLASAFRLKSRSCHPDKDGTTEQFNSLVVAYQSAQKALKQR